MEPCSAIEVYRDVAPARKTALSARAHTDGAMAEANQPDAPARKGKAQSPRLSNWEYRSSMLAVLLMAAATLGSSWSAYQSSLWNGVQIFRLNDAAALSREANQKTTMANQQRAMDAALFVECSRDYYEGKQQLAEFFLYRMRPELRQVVEAWLATRPLKNPNAPSNPFVMPEYRLKLDDQIRDLEAKSDAGLLEARRANRTSDTYTLIGVIYTSALFLSGLVSGFDQKLVRRILLAMSFSMLVVALAIMVRQPITYRG